MAETTNETGGERCPRCGNPVAPGTAGRLCPKCLLATAMEEETQPLAPNEAGEPRPASSRGLPQPGEQLGHYAIEKTLGRGGMGAVYEALDLDNGRRVALKVLSHALDEPGARQRFLREGRLAASINHPNSVYVFGTEEIAGTPVISMELMPGGTLLDRVRASGPLAPSQAVDAILQIIAGLEAARNVGILHRDVKPSNCFLGPAGEVKIGDFGLSISASIRTEPAITATGSFLGTPAFSSPEQLRGEELNARSDIYSVGATLFYLLTGRTAFECNNMVQMLATILEQKPPSPGKLRAGIPRGLSQVVLRCMEKQPSERFRSYAELSRALAPYSSEAPNPATLGLRFVAGVVDTLVLSIAGSLAFWFGLGSSYDFLELSAMSSPRAIPLMALWIAATVLYYALFESLAGATPGKAICRLRVIGSDKGLPRCGAALIRASLYVALPILPFWTVYLVRGQLYSPSDTWMQMFIGSSYYLMLGALFATARRANGFAALQDLASSTRVVSRVALATRPHLSMEPPLEVKEGAAPNLGPYHILQPLGSAEGGNEWLLGYDLRLLRKVWIRKLGPGDSPLASRLRNLGRPGRLRWLTENRAGAEQWEAYEALNGRPLLALLRQRQSWGDVRFWLHDLAEELAAAARDGTVPAVLAFDRVWITEDGRAKLLDFSAPTLPAQAQPPATSVNGAEFLSRVAHAAVEGDEKGKDAKTHGRPSVPLPLHARELLVALKTVVQPEAAAALLRPLLHRPAQVSRMRRAALVAGCMAVPLLAAGAAMLGGSMMAKWSETNPGLLELSQVLQFRGHSRFWQRAPQRPTDEQIAAYIASRYSQTITNGRIWTNHLALAFIKGEDRRFAERSLEIASAMSAEERSQAVKALEPILPKVASMTYLHQPWLPSMVAASALAFYVAFPAVLAALLFRGGLLLRVAGVTFARKDGAPASRLRLLWRSVAAWSVVPICFALFLSLRQPLGVMTASGVAWLAALVLAALSLAMTGRGLPDRLAGTWPVPR